LGTISISVAIPRAYLNFQNREKIRANYQYNRRKKMKDVRPWILGVSSGYHNGAACLCHGDEIIVAMQEERLTRRKREPILHGRRSLAVEYCLVTANIRPEDIDLVVDCTITASPRDANDSIDESIHAMLGGAERLPEVVQIPHHLGHALSVFYTSGFEESVVLVIDGGGSPGWQLPQDERAAVVSFDENHNEHLSIYHATHHGITLVEKHMSDMSYLRDPNRKGMMLFGSLGHMFSSVALQIFGDYMEAGKVMALAPFGKPRIPVEEFFQYDGRTFKFSNAVPNMFGRSERWPQREKEYRDLAASVQNALEHGLSSISASIIGRKLSYNLSYAGGVALNSVANYKVLRNAGYRNIYVIPAAEDSGTAIGAAYYGLTKLRKAPSSCRLQTDSLGRQYTLAEVDAAISQLPELKVIETSDVVTKCVDLLCDGHVVGWFQGGAEFGPRALGHRSILCDPRKPDAKEMLNSRVKHREAFRPFAPAILAENAVDWFVLNGPTDLTDFMLEVCPFRAPLPGVDVPAVIHVDGTGRLQTVTKTNNELFYRLIRAFQQRTGVPMIVNTSLNIMGEPIAETPRDALWLLLFTGVDYCVIENRIVTKAPSFTSVLDLVPCRTPLGDTLLSGNSGSDDGTSLIADTKSYKWGVDVLNRIDDRSSFRELFGKTIQTKGYETECMRIVGYMFAHSLIAFKRSA
jgi:carbamoyltransferase